MDLYYKQEVKVGVLVLVAIIALFAGLVWLTGKSFASGELPLMVRFASVNGLSNGDLVQISGVQVGRVASIDLESEGSVVVGLEVAGDHRPMVDATASVQSSGFLGEVFVDYHPGTSATPLDPDVVINGTSRGDLSEVASQLSDNAVDVMLGAQKMLSEEMATELRATLAATRRALEAIARVSEGPLFANASASFAAFERAGNRVDSTLANPGLNNALSQLDEVTESLTEMAAGFANATNSLSDLLEQLGDTSGTFGQLMASDTVHTELHKLLTSMRLLIDDMREHPQRYTLISVF